MSNDEKLQKVLDMAEIGNYLLHSSFLMIPLLKELKVRSVDDPHVVLFADGDYLCEQLINDGFIEEKDVDLHIDRVIDNAKSFMKDIRCKELDKNFLFHKELKTSLFHFKIYVQDIVFDDDGYKIIRQFNAYFYEPRMKDFYQFSLSSGPYDYSTTTIQVGEINLISDEITKKLDHQMDLLLNYIKYQKEEG